MRAPEIGYKLTALSDLENTAPRIESSFTPEHVDLIEGQRRRQKRRERKLKRIIAAAVGWATIALMIYLMAVTTRSQPKIWDPYEILDIPMVRASGRERKTRDTTNEQVD